MKRIHACLAGCTLFFILSCSQGAFEKEFGCETPMSFTNKKEFNDVLNHFSMEFPKKWKTKLYYDEYQSKIYSADTTKNLSETYIIDVTWHQGELLINEAFEEKINKNVQVELDLIPVKWDKGEYLGKPAFYHISTGKTPNMNWHYLQIYRQHKPDEYYTFTSKIYGDELVDERLCASFAVFKEIEFLEP